MARPAIPSGAVLSLTPIVDVLSLLSATQQVHRTCRARASEIVGQTNARTLDLAIARITAELRYQFHDLCKTCRADGVTLRLQASTHIDRNSTAPRCRPFKHRRTSLSLLEKTEILSSQDLRYRKTVVHFREVHLLRG